MTETDKKYFTIEGNTITKYDPNGPKNVVIPSEIDGVTIENIKKVLSWVMNKISCFSKYDKNNMSWSPGNWELYGREWAKQ